MTGNNLNLVHYNWTRRRLVLHWDMGIISRVTSSLDKKYQEEWQIIMTIIDLMSSVVDSQPPDRKIYVGY